MATLADLLIEIGVDAREVAKGADGVEGKLKKTWASVGKAAAIGGAAIGAALLAGIDQVIETSKPMALLSAQLGGGEAVAQQMGAAAGKVYAKGVADSMDEAAGAVRDAWQNKLIKASDSDAAIQSVSNKLITLGKTTESSTKEVSSAVSQMLRTGLAQSADEAFDVIQRGITAGVNKSDDLLDTFNEYGTQFRKFGLSAESAMGLLSQGLQGGARDADVVADSIKELALRIGDGSAAAAGGFKEIGMNGTQAMKDFAKGGDDAQMVLSDILENLNKIKDPAKKNAAALDLFGTKFEDLGDAAFSLNLGNAVSGLGKVKGAADEAGKALEESAGAKLESFKRSAQAALVDKLAEAIPYLEATAKWVQRNSEVLGPLAIVFGVLATALGIAAIAQWAMNSAMLASPVTWMIVGFGLIVAGLVILATKTKFFQTVWAGVWGFLKAVGAWFAGPFAGFFVTVGSKIKNFAASVWGAIRSYFGYWRGLFVSVKNWAVSAVNSIVTKFNSFVSYVKSIPGKIRGSLSSMWNGMKDGFRSAINWVISKWNGLSFRVPSINVFGQTFGGGTIGVPSIPQLAEGGIVPATPGGRLVNVGEGGRDEAVVPLGRGGLPDLGGRDDRPIVVQIVPGGEPEFRRWVNKTIRVKGAIVGVS